MTELATISHEIDFGLPDEKIVSLRARLENVTADTQIGYNKVKAGISEVRKLRTSVEKARKLLKADALEWGRRVDAEAKRLTEMLLEVELPLKDKKQAVDDEAERLRIEEEQAKAEAERKEREEREAAERAKYEAEQAEIRKQQEAEQERLEAERVQLQKEREAIEAEKRKLAEAQRKREAAERAERERLEAEERAKREAIEAEQRAKEQAKREKAEREEAERLAKERMPDREKLQQLVCDLHEFQSSKVPKMSTDWGRQLSIDAGTQLVELAEYIENNVNILDQTPS